MRSQAVHILSIAFSLALSCVSLSADTLILRNGQRVQGELRSVRNDTIEFDEDRGFRGRRTLEFDRDEVARIEFDNGRRDGGSSGGSGGRPAGLREREVTVSADVQWSDAGVDVRSGQTLYFDAIGNVRWGKDRRDGPAGERNSPYNANRPIPRRPAAALIGKIGGDSDDYFFIGDDKGPIRVQSTGRMYLGINDDYLQDNSGNFRVTVFY